MIYLFLPLSARPSSSWCHWTSTYCFQIELDWISEYSNEIVIIYWCCQQVKWVTRQCKSKFCRKQQSKRLCHRKWANPEKDPIVVPSTSHYSLQIREKKPSATSCSVSFMSMWWVKPPQQLQSFHSQICGTCWILVQPFQGIICKVSLCVSPT